jgi:hypothetical protein
MSILKAKGPDSDGNYQIPCDSTMTWNLHGTQKRNYTFDLADKTTKNGKYCYPLANDAGDTTNWLVHFL